jgi:hypothetical protein
MLADESVKDLVAELGIANGTLSKWRRRRMPTGTKSSWPNSRVWTCFAPVTDRRSTQTRLPIARRQSGDTCCLFEGWTSPMRSDVANLLMSTQSRPATDLPTSAVTPAARHRPHEGSLRVLKGKDDSLRTTPGARCATLACPQHDADDSRQFVGSQRRGQRRRLGQRSHRPEISACVGSGQGVALVLENANVN